MAWYLRFILSIHVTESLTHLLDCTMYAPQGEENILVRCDEGGRHAHTI